MQNVSGISVEEWQSLDNGGTEGRASHPKKQQWQSYTSQALPQVSGTCLPWAGLSLIVCTPGAESQPPSPTPPVSAWEISRKTSSELWGATSNRTPPQMKIKQVWNANAGQWEKKTLFMIHYVGDFSGKHMPQPVGYLWKAIKLLWLSFVN